MSFKKPPMGKRGYDEEDVDAFLDDAEQELTRLVMENAALHDQVQHGRQGPPAASQTMVINSELADVAAQLEHMQAALARAENQARRLQAQLEQAQREHARSAAAPPAGGNNRDSPVLAMAQRTADDHIRDADQSCADLLRESRDKAAKLTSEAQLKARTVESEARRTHADSINSIQVERAALLDEIDRLSGLADGYRAALQSHIVAQTQDLDGSTGQA